MIDRQAGHLSMTVKMHYDDMVSVLFTFTCFLLSLCLPVCPSDCLSLSLALMALETFVRRTVTAPVDT